MKSPGDGPAKVVEIKSESSYYHWNVFIGDEWIENYIHRHEADKAAKRINEALAAWQEANK